MKKDISINNLNKNDDVSPSGPSKHVREKKKNQKNVQRTVVLGNEYQRIIQILIRDRSYKLDSSCKVGVDVSDVSKLDDVVVYSEENYCRFFQIKHHTECYYRECNLFSERQSDRVTNNDIKTNNERKAKLDLSDFFIPFVQIKYNSRFKNCKIKELTIVTNSPLTCEKRKNYLSPDSTEDDILSLSETELYKYRIIVESVQKLHHLKKKLKIEFEDIYQKELIKENLSIKQMVNSDFEELYEEFLTKLCLVFKYPDIETLKNKVQQEIFSEEFMHPETGELLQHCMLHSEIEILSLHTEYLSSAEWELIINRIKNAAYNHKIETIHEYEYNKLLRIKLRFTEKSATDMCKDLNNCLEDSHCRVMYLNLSEKVELNIIKLLSFLDKKYSNSFFVCTVEGLLSTNDLLDYLLLRKFKLLVIVCHNISYDIEEIIVKIKEAVKKEPEIKYLFISRSEELFNNYEEICNSPNYSKSLSIGLSNGYKDLDDTSKQKILKKQIQFQAKSVSLGSIFLNIQDGSDFAEAVIDESCSEVIDESCLWKIINPTQKCIVSNTEALSSLEWDDTYYSEKFHLSVNGMIEKLTANEKVIKLIGKEEKKIIVLVRKSSEVKSNILTHIEKLIKEQFKFMGVIKVNLGTFFVKNKYKDFSDLKKDNPNCLQSAIQMAFKMAFPKKCTRLEEALFKEGLRKNKLKMVILLDGFNEVGRNTQIRLITFIETIESKVEQILITTQMQNDGTSRLEDKFKCVYI